ncbi:hypothetical protein HPB52_000249 [Rhipicephalus sanguineus]|uniref:Uncharacterized protein n=1 Tax=Rhipicephalus sanguineus TaxID=34632 RepID=A0A9D4PN57_RHISA|nr:hypothetical protein HPB52_000249 [Rhipicephalus sanguineus]
MACTVQHRSLVVVLGNRASPIACIAHGRHMYTLLPFPTPGVPRAHMRKDKNKKTIPKPVPYMCDICHVFGKSAFELNEEVKDSEDKKPKNPELYCDVCQLLLPSLGTKREHEKSKKHKFLEALRKNGKTESRSKEATSAKKSESTKTVTAARTAKTLHCSVCQMDLESNEAMEEHIESKKHKFLSALKPVPLAPVRRPEEGTRHKRSGSRDSGPDRREWRRGKRRNEEEEEEIPELAAVALERRALQAQLAQRRQEIEEQRRLIAELREEQHLEAEKAALRHMIDECRKLIEEREKNKRRAAEVEERISRKTAKSVQWHPSVTTVKKEPEDPRWAKSRDYEEPRERLSLVKKAQEEWEREQLEKARSRGHAQPASTTVKQEEDDWEKERPSGESTRQCGAVFPKTRMTGTVQCCAPHQAVCNCWGKNQDP